MEKRKRTRILNMITEDTSVEFKQYSELSYRNSRYNVELFVNDEIKGFCKVWKDSEEFGREYITLNNEIVYLDTLTERKCDF